MLGTVLFWLFSVSGSRFVFPAFQAFWFFASAFYSPMDYSAVIAGKRTRFADLEDIIGRPNFYDDAKKAGEMLREHRALQKLMTDWAAFEKTQQELAERSRLSVRAISDLERGVKLAPRASPVRLLADGLGLDTLGAAELREAARRDRAPDSNRVRGHNLPAHVSSFVGLRHFSPCPF